MPIIQEQRTSKGVSYSLTLPKAIVKAKGWGKGTDVEVILSNGDIILREKK